MARPRNTDGDIDDLGVLITAAFGLPTEWMRQGECYGWGTDKMTPTPWQVAPGKMVAGVKTAELVKYALLMCRNCPVQWDCASYAVKAQMIAGTWSMPVTALRALQALGEQAFDLIEIARRSQVPMQEVMRTPPPNA